MPDRRVLVAGWVGSKNLGDELILRALIAKLRRLDAEPVAISIDPDATRAEHHVDAIGHRDLRAQFAAAGSSAGMVFGGGGLLQDETSRFNLPFHLSRVALARSRGLPVALFGMGAGPIRTRLGRTLTTRALDRDHVFGTVRDADSADVLAGLGLARPVVAADPVLSLSGPSADPVDEIAVCLRPWHGGGIPPVEQTWRKGLDNEWFPRAMAAALDEAAGRTGLGVRLVALQAGRDTEMQRLVAEHMTVEPTMVTPSLETVLDEVGRCRIAVSLRYHGAIVATLAHRPSVVVGYSDKVLSLANELGPAARGVPWSPAGVDGIGAEVERLLDDAPDVAEPLARLRDRERANDLALERLVEPSRRTRGG